MKILVVDDQKDNVELLCQILEDADFNVIPSYNGKEAIIAAEKELPDVILLDIHMPEMDGYEACKILKQNSLTSQIPIVFLTANTAEESVVKGLNLGAYDYVTKPFNEKELLARIKVMARIRASEQKAETMALTDPLTELYNRRFLMQKFEEEISRAKREKKALSCLMLDVDHFKNINDTYGHDAGDEVLKRIAACLKENLRGYDAIVRYGGEEFVVLLPNTEKESAVAVGEKIRIKVAEEKIKSGVHTISITISIGVFGSKGESLLESAEEYISCADKALYLAKNTGRNKVVLFG